MSSLTPGILVRSGSQQNPVVYGLQMQKDINLTNLTVPFDQGVVLPKISSAFVPQKKGNTIIPISNPVQDTNIESSFVAGAGTSVNSDSTFDGYTLAQIVAILKVRGIIQ